MLYFCYWEFLNSWSKIGILHSIQIPMYVILVLVVVCVARLMTNVCTTLLSHLVSCSGASVPFSPNNVSSVAWARPCYVPFLYGVSPANPVSCDGLLLFLVIFCFHGFSCLCYCPWPPTARYLLQCWLSGLPGQPGVTAVSHVDGGCRSGLECVVKMQRSL